MARRITSKTLVFCGFALLSFFLPARAQDDNEVRLKQLHIDAQCHAYDRAYTFSGLKDATKPYAPPAATRSDDTDIQIRAIRQERSNRSKCDGTRRVLPPVVPADQKLARLAPSACVIVNFDIDEDGNTENVSIAKRFPADSNRRLRKLDRAAIDSVKANCYAPKIENNDAVSQTDITSKINFFFPAKKQPWEKPSTLDQIDVRAKHFEQISRASCDLFETSYNEMVSLDNTPGVPIPSSKNVPDFVDAVPVKRSAPRWPGNISALEISHSCVVTTFDINESGRTENIKVIYRAPQTSAYQAFEEVTINAIKEWEYKPATLQSAPVRQSNVRTKLTFSSSED